MEVLLGSPPPPPPPNVPALEETEGAEDGRFLTVRERQAQHRANPACATCHNVIDPIGLSFENFDPTGAWRIRDGGNLVDGSSTEATLVETHLNAEKNGFGLRALFAYWDIDSGEAKSIGRDEQYGFYVEPSYRFWEDKLGVFGRYSRWNTAAGGQGASELIEEWSTGMNYWPHPNVVFKFDYQWQDAANGISKQLEGFNFGVGYQF